MASNDPLDRLYEVIIGDDRKAMTEAITSLLAEKDIDQARALKERIAARESFDREQVIPKQKTMGLKPGMNCGPFRIEEVIGSGGMGSVYRAVRQGDLNLEVALKVLNYWDPQQLEMFRKECRILSSLTHPNIARLIDADTNETGQPWLAMEYMKGQTLKHWIAKNDPSLKKRLELFLNLCGAVTHAHGQMIVHRDIKPSNIMIGEDGRLKLLDFGIASILNPDTGAQKTVTYEMERLLTPEYASPEQLSGLRLTTSTDIYSLGVVLYEMLTGQRPYEFKNRHPMAMIAVVNEEPIPKPSNIIKKEGKSRISFASALHGDLDTIILKALEKSPENRYASVDQFARDIQLFLWGQPIQARPATRMYRLGKFIARNPWSLAMTAGLVLLLLSFSVYAQKQRMLIREERDQAQKQQQIAESVTDFLVNMFKQVDPDAAKDRDITAVEILELGRKQLALEASSYPKVNARLLETMGSVYLSLGQAESAKTMYEDVIELQKGQGLKTLNAELKLIDALQQAGQYLVSQEKLNKLEAQTMKGAEEHAFFSLLMARQLIYLGHYIQADEVIKQELKNKGLSGEYHELFLQENARLLGLWGYQKQAISILEDLLKRAQMQDPESSKVARIHLKLAEACIYSGTFKESKKHYAKAEQIIEAIYPESHPINLVLNQTHGMYLKETGDIDGAVAYFKDRITFFEGHLDPSHEDLITTKMELANALHRKGSYAEAEKLYRACFARVDLNKKLKAYLYEGYGNVLRDQGDYEAARQTLNLSLSLFTEQKLDQSPEFALFLTNLAYLLELTNHLEDAINLYLRVKAIQENHLGKDHPKYATTLNNLGLALQHAGRSDECEALLKQSYDIRLRVFGEKHYEVANSLNNLGFHYELRSELPLAVDYYQRAIDSFDGVLSDDHISVLTLKCNLATLYQKMNKRTLAEPLFLDVVRLFDTKYKKEHPDYQRTLGNYAHFLIKGGRFEEGERIIYSILDHVKERFGVQSPQYHNVQYYLALSALHQGKFSDAHDLLHATLDSFEGDEHMDSPDYALSLQDLAVLYLKQRQLKKAQKYAEEALALFRSKEMISKIAFSNLILAETAAGLGDRVKAKSHLKGALEFYEKNHYGINLEVCRSVQGLLQAMEQDPQGEIALRRSYEAIAARSGKGDYLDTQPALYRLIAGLRHLGKHDEAESLSRNLGKP